MLYNGSCHHFRSRLGRLTQCKPHGCRRASVRLIGPEDAPVAKDVAKVVFDTAIQAPRQLKRPTRAQIKAQSASRIRKTKLCQATQGAPRRARCPRPRLLVSVSLALALAQAAVAKSSPATIATRACRAMRCDPRDSQFKHPSHF